MTSNISTPKSATGACQGEGSLRSVDPVAALRARIASLGEWYHQIDFGNGVVSPAPRRQQIEYFKFTRLGRSGGPLLGWEPSASALHRMMELAGYRNIKLISQRPHPGEGAGVVASNDVYFCADAPEHPVMVPHILEGKPWDL